MSSIERNTRSESCVACFRLEVESLTTQTSELDCRRWVTDEVPRGYLLCCGHAKREDMEAGIEQLFFESKRGQRGTMGIFMAVRNKDG